jgi:predicted Fe-Mo cluster-binding NifX family protein
VRIAVAASGRWLDSIVDYHTGRACCFILYDTDLESHEVFDNRRCSGYRHWAGSHAANVLIESGANVVIVRNIGPVTFRSLANADIDVLIVEEVPVVRAIRLFRDGRLSKAKGPNCQGHSHLRE